MPEDLPLIYCQEKLESSHLTVQVGGKIFEDVIERDIAKFVENGRRSEMSFAQFPIDDCDQESASLE